MSHVYHAVEYTVPNTSNATYVQRTMGMPSISRILLIGCILYGWYKN